MKKVKKTLHLYKKVVSDLSGEVKGGLVRQVKGSGDFPTNDNTMCDICPDHQNNNW